MLKRDLLLGLGGWDEVRVAADSELIRRLEHGFVQGRVTRVLHGVPLSFALVNATSLTQTSLTHARTLQHGVRRTYEEASIHWLESRPSMKVALPGRGKGRAFPAARFILSDRKDHPQLDLLLIHDFSRDDAQLAAAFEDLARATGSGLRVGVFQWHHYDSDVTKPLHRELLELAQAGTIEVITPGEEVIASQVLCRQGRILLDRVDLPPRLSTESFTIVSVDCQSHDAAEISRAVESSFGVEPRWVSTFP